MKAREAINYLSDPENWLDFDAVKRARAICSAACDVWDVRRKMIEHTSKVPAPGADNVRWLSTETRLALELSKAEAALIALEDAQ